MSKPRTPDAERFCRYCGIWIGGMDIPKYIGLACVACYNDSRVKDERARRNGTWVRKQPSSISREESDENIAIAAAHKIETCGGDVRHLFKVADDEQSE